MMTAKLLKKWMQKVKDDGVTYNKISTRDNQNSW